MNTEDLAGMIMFSGLKTDELTKHGFAYKDGKSLEDLKKAVQKGLHQGRGKVEHEQQWIAYYIESVVVTPRKAGSRCMCRRAMPWHLFEVATSTYKHNCACGRSWAWHDSTTARYAGRWI